MDFTSSMGTKWVKLNIIYLFEEGHVGRSFLLCKTPDIQERE